MAKRDDFSLPNRKKSLEPNKTNSVSHNYSRLECMNVNNKFIKLLGCCLANLILKLIANLINSIKIHGIKHMNKENTISLKNRIYLTPPEVATSSQNFSSSTLRSRIGKMRQVFPHRSLPASAIKTY